MIVMGVMEVMRKGMVPAEMANGRIVSLCTPDPAASVRRARPPSESDASWSLHACTIHTKKKRANI